MILYHFVAMYQSHLAHFAIEALNELGIARWFFINMHITLGVPFFIFFSSSKCLFKGCGGEIHIDWWAFSSIKKPCEDDKGRGANHLTMAFVSWIIYKMSS